MGWVPADTFMGMVYDGLAERCTSCGSVLAASDADTLAWGKLRHEAGHDGSGTLADPWGLRALMLGEHEDGVKATVCCWLIGVYGRPFVFHPADGSPCVVVT